MVRSLTLKKNFLINIKEPNKTADPCENKSLVTMNEWINKLKEWRTNNKLLNEYVQCTIMYT